MIYTAGNLASKVISFVMIFFITFYLTKEEIGLYDIIITTIAVLSPFVNLQLTDAILRWMLDGGTENNASKIFTNVICLFLLCTLTFVFFYAVVSHFVSISYELLILLLILAQSLLPLLLMMARGDGKNVLFAFSGVIYSAIYTLLTLSLIIIYEYKIEGLLLANIAATFITSFFVLITGGYYSSFNIKLLDFRFSRELLIFSLPMIPNALAWWLYTSANRYVVLYYLGLENSGIWAIAYKIPTILAILNSVFFMAWQEKSIREYKSPNRDNYYSETLQKFVSLSMGAVIVLVAASKPILYFIVEKSFFISWQYSVFLLLASFFQSLALFYGVGYICGKETKYILSTTIIGSVCTIILSIALTPFFGLFGAGIGTLLGFFIMFLIRLQQTKKYFTIRFPLLKTMLMLAAVCICYGFSYFESVAIQLFNVVFALSIAIYTNKDFLKGKLNQLKQIYETRKYA